MINSEQKEFCANNLASQVIVKLIKMNPDERKSKIISDFMMSKTYDNLYDYETGLWEQGPDYILDLYQKSKF